MQTWEDEELPRLERRCSGRSRLRSQPAAPLIRAAASAAEPELGPTAEQLLEEHRYAFELQGFVVVENVLT